MERGRGDFNIEIDGGVRKKKLNSVL